MIHSRIRIGDGDIEDCFAKWGLIYLDADERTEAPIKERDKTSYAEEAGEHLDRRTVQDAFDYTVKFLIETPNRFLTSANAKIEALNRALYEQESGSDVRKYKRVVFYNDFNRVKIAGIACPIEAPTELFRRQDGSVMDCAQVELKIRVTDPRQCNFNLGDTENVLLEDGGGVLLEDGGLLLLEIA